MQEKVVITGLGVIAPGNSLNVEAFWNTIISGESTADFITHFDAEKYSTRFACEIKGFDPLNYMDKKKARKRDRSTQVAIAATHEAVKMAGITPETCDYNRIGVIIGSGIGGISTLEEEIGVLNSRGPSRVSPFVIPMFILNIISGEVSIEFGFKGINYGVCSACASATHAIGISIDLIRKGAADIIITGGAEAAICPIGVSGFCSLRALSTRNDAPKKASRPFDLNRDGFVMGEGAGILVLESLTNAKRRNAKIYAEAAGGAATGDAYHITAPAPAGEGAARCFSAALNDANLKPEDIDYINAHGTSTDLNDTLETQAIKTVFGEHSKKINISSIKSTVGHLLGAAGGVEAIATVLAIQKSIIPPTINYETPDPECDLNYTPNTPVNRVINAAISDSLGFGGHNAAIVLKKFEG